MVAVALLAVAWNILAGTDILTTATKCTGAGATKRAVLACSQLKAALPDIVTLPAQVQQYDDLRDDNWSHTTWQRPACIAAPTRSDHVSALVKTLVKANVPFAIRSGGHSPNPGDASIGSNGVLLSLHALNTITYDAATGLVSIGPGARWGAVYDELDKYNLTAVGGRVMDVGVGGLSLGGGLSYLSDLHGFVCDNVVSYEVVLADGRVVEASADSHSDLFWALKGGSNNFGMSQPSQPLFQHPPDTSPQTRINQKHPPTQASSRASRSAPTPRPPFGAASKSSPPTRRPRSCTPSTSTRPRPIKTRPPT